jgi:hypothetical protein
MFFAPVYLSLSGVPGTWITNARWHQAQGYMRTCACSRTTASPPAPHASRGVRPMRPMVLSTSSTVAHTSSAVTSATNEA